MKSMILTVVAAATALLAAAPAAAAPEKALFGSSEDESAPRATLTLDGVVTYLATDTGWITENGRHIADNANYLTGLFSDTRYNSWFNFLLPALAPVSPYTSATLTIASGESLGTGPFALGLFDVDADLIALDAERSAGNVGGQALFADLGSGASYGGITVNGPYSIGDTIEVTLNQAFLDRVNAGLVSDFSIGGTLSPTTAVPEPATWAMMIGGIGLAGAALRRRATVRFRTA